MNKKFWREHEALVYGVGDKRPANNQPMTSIDSESPDWAWRSSGYAWWVVILLALGLTLSFADRMIVALTIGPLKHDLQLSDSQVGLLQGLGFTLLYVLAGLPLGRIADTSSRRALAGSSVAIWSIATAACAACSSFGTFFTARSLVGIGEAGLSPTALSLVSDYFPKQRRTKPLALLALGATAGLGFSFMIGGSIIHAVSRAGLLQVPALGRLHAWQAAYLTLGVIGLLFSLLFVSVREPPRRERTSTAHSSVSAFLGFLSTKRVFFITQILGVSLSGLAMIGFYTWMPALLSRKFGWTGGTTGIIYGACLVVGGCTAVVLCGAITDHLVKRGIKNAPQKISFWAVVAAILPLTFGPLLPTPLLVIASATLGTSLIQMFAVLAPAMIQQASPNEFRSQSFALYLCIASIAGYGLGPLIVPMVTDWVLHNETMVNFSLAIIAGCFTPISALVLGLGLLYGPAESTRPAEGPLITAV